MSISTSDGLAHCLPARRSERSLIALGIVLSVVMVAMSLTPAERAGARPLDVWAVVLLLVAYGSLAWCRRNPVAALVITQLATSMWFPRNYVGALTAPALLAAIFLVTVLGNRKLSVIALTVLVGPFTIAAMFSSDLNSVTTAAGIIGWMVAAALLGEAVHKRRALEAEYEHRAEMAAAEQHAEMERRLAEERLRVARDLHDVLAHTVTAMSIQAAVASDAVDLDREAAHAALANLRRQARQTVEDVRASIGSLRASVDSTIDAVPGLAGIEGLAELTAQSGLTVTVRTSGTRPRLPELVDVNAYRIVQEALTNVQRHSLATTASVSFDAKDDALTITISDPGPQRLPRHSPGFGIIGMRERAIATGGSLDVNPTLYGGFEVVANLPLHSVWQ